MKSYKERTLIAWEELAWKYRNSKGQTFGIPSECPTCQIYRSTHKHARCFGCPMSRDDGSLGCLDFKTYRDASQEDKFIPRAEFFKKTLPMLKEIPAKYFTPSRWTLEAFAFLDRSW